MLNNQSEKMIQMKHKILGILALLGVLISCNDNEIYEREMYKNVVALISSDYHNTFQEVVHMTGEEIIGYVAVSVGGTYAPSSDMIINLEEDDEQLGKYNYAVFDADSARYAKMLAKDRYQIADYKIRVKAGERTGRTMIRLRPEGLSPDSTYFISLKATAGPGVELNEKKNTILYQVVLQNDYASRATSSLYTMMGLVDGMATSANKELFPLTYNSVRMIAGNETFEPKEELIYQKSIILEMDGDNNVTIKPYGSILVNQLDGDPKYPNVFMVEESFGMKTNVFLLSYEYTLGGVTKVMQERVEMQVREN